MSKLIKGYVVKVNMKKWSLLNSVFEYTMDRNTD
jgi:hypothetical protein